jgi:hypothetical protein
MMRTAELALPSAFDASILLLSLFFHFIVNVGSLWRCSRAARSRLLFVVEIALRQQFLAASALFVCCLVCPCLSSVAN